MRDVRLYLVGSLALLGLFGCGRSGWFEQREPWRHEAEVAFEAKHLAQPERASTESQFRRIRGKILVDERRFAAELQADERLELPLVRNRGRRDDEENRQRQESGSHR